MNSPSFGIDSPEYKVLQILAPQVKSAIQHDLHDLSLQLLSCGMITEDNHEDFSNEIIPTYQRASKLLRVVQSRVAQNPLNYATFVSVLENKGPHNYYQSVLSQLSHTLMDESTHHGSTSTQLTIMDQKLDGDSQSLHKYYWYIVIFTLINFLLNIIVRIVIAEDGMIKAVTASQILLYLAFIFIFVLGVVMKDQNTIEIGIFGFGLSVGIIILVGIIMIVCMSI